MRIFLAGGTGLVGTRLIARLKGRGDDVVLLTRRPDAARQKFGEGCTVVEGDPTQPGAWADALAGCDAVVNLVGENVFARRWSKSFKELLRSSRVQSTENVVAALARSPKTADGRGKVLVNASAIGYYGPTDDEELDETRPPDDDFLGRLCVEWERAAQAAAAFGVRVVMLRIGVVFDREGGALREMLRPFKMFVGGPVGSGRQYVSWIHHEDMAGLILLALDTEQATGPINATAPNPVTNREVAKAIGRVLRRPSFMKAPWFMLRAALGEVANIITTGQRVVPRRALELGYSFKFPEVEGALRDVLAVG